MLSIFKKKKFDSNTFEKEFTELMKQVTDSYNDVIKSINQKKNVKKLLRNFFLGFFLILLSYFYFNITFNRNGIKHHETSFFKELRIKEVIFLFAYYPLLCYVIKKTVMLFFNYRIKQRQKKLQKIKEKHKCKIEELKQVTNFNKTNDLLSKFGHFNFCENTNSPQKKNKNENTSLKNIKKINTGIALNTERQNVTLDPNEKQHLKTIDNESHKKSIYDWIFNVLIGSNDNDCLDNRFALICSNCFFHNGLAPPKCKDPKEISYFCQKCNFLNSDKNKKTLVHEKQINTTDQNIEDLNEKSKENQIQFKDTPLSQEKDNESN